MDKRLFLLSFGLLLFLGCAITGILNDSNSGPQINSQKPVEELPYNGVFFMKDQSLIEAYYWEGNPSSADEGDFPASEDTHPKFFVWLPQIQLDYFILYDIRSGNEIPYDIMSEDNGIFEMRSEDPLPEGDYCFYQGDPLASPVDIMHWCFHIGFVVSYNDGRPKDCVNITEIDINKIYEEKLIGTDNIGDKGCYKVNLEAAKSYYFRANDNPLDSRGPSWYIYDSSGEEIFRYDDYGGYSGGIKFTSEESGPVYIGFNIGYEGSNNITFHISDDIEQNLSGTELNISVGGFNDFMGDSNDFTFEITKIEIYDHSFVITFNSHGNGLLRPETSCIHVAGWEKGNGKVVVSTYAFPINFKYTVEEFDRYAGRLEFPRIDSNSQPPNEYEILYGCWASHDWITLFSEYSTIPQPSISSNEPEDSASSNSSFPPVTLSDLNREKNWYIGNWEGVGTQTFNSIELQMTINEMKINSIIGSVYYPLSGCRGELTLRAINEMSIRVEEKFDDEMCFDGYSYTLNASGENSIIFESFPEGEDIRIGLGSMNRISEPESVNVGASPTKVTEPSDTMNSCPYSDFSDRETFINLSLAEEKANLEEDMDIIRAIFFEDAEVRDYNNNNIENAYYFYEIEFKKRDFIELTHYDFQIIDNTGNEAWFTASDSGILKITESGEIIQYTTEPGATHYYFTKDNMGCWKIKYFAIGAQNEKYPWP